MIKIILILIITFYSYTLNAEEYISFSQPQEIWTEESFDKYFEWYFNDSDNDLFNILNKYSNQSDLSLKKKIRLHHHSIATSFFNHEQALVTIRTIVEQNKDSILTWINNPENKMSRQFSFEFTESIGYGFFDFNPNSKELLYSARIVINKTLENKPIIISSFPILN